MQGLRPRLFRSYLPILLSLAVGVSVTSCRRRHISVPSVPELGYPTCGGVIPSGPGESLVHAHLRAGPTSLERDVVEYDDITRRDCLYVATVRQEWSRGTADVEVVYDAQWLPLRIWKRMTIPGVQRADGQADFHRYELRTPETTIKHRDSDGNVTYEILRGARPRAVVGPGRGLFTLWIQRAHLSPGGTLRETVIDVREQVEVIREATLRREPDMQIPWLGHTARVYTIYGRETVYTDEHDVVIGDLAGLRPSATLTTPEPPPLPLYGAPDPVHTP